MKKVGKNTRTFRYNLNEITYDYLVEVPNSFKGLVLVDRMPEELWREVCYIVHEMVTKTISQREKKNAKRQSGCLRRPYKLLRKDEKRKTKEKGKDIPN